MGSPDIPSSIPNPDAALFDFDRDLIGSSRPMLHKHQPRFFRYLPLYSGSVYISGLTVYLSGNGIIGLEAHFTETSQLSGSRNGCPKYFPLHPSERIACAWLRVANSRSPVFSALALTVSGIRIRCSLLLIYLRRFKRRWEEVACLGHMFSQN
jgi:hypothetical protein